MNRREFLNYSLPTAGAVMLAPGFFNFQAMAEINRQFISEDIFDEYDVVINGAGLSGYFAAIEASQKGLKVLVVEKRPSPGYEITAKRKLWIGDDGLNHWDSGLTQLFFPLQEQQEIFNQGGVGLNNSHFGDELLLLAGTVKKGMLRNLLVNHVHVLLMTDVCGIFSDEKNVTGVLLACKQGLYSVKCRNFIDASDNLLFSRDLAGQKYRIKTGGFVLELLGAVNSQKKIVQVPEKLGVLNNKVQFHLGKNVSPQLFIEFQFPVASQNIEDIEKQSRLIAGEIGRNLPELDDSLKEAKIHYYAYESSFVLDAASLPKTALLGHFVLASENDELTCARILKLQESAVQCIKELNWTKTTGETKLLVLPGTTIPYKQVEQSRSRESGLSMPLVKCDFSFSKWVQNEKQCQVLVGGAGTSGAVAAIGAAERGADVIAADYFNDPGGTKTLGGVMGYYHGMRVNSYLDKLEDESDQLSSEIHFSKKPGRQFYLLKRLSDLNTKFLSGAIICGAVVKNKRVEGIVICRNGKLEKIMGDIVIDATGDGDIACFSGAEAEHGNARNGLTQNYSQWNLTGGGKSPSNTNSDYDIIDNTKIAELQRGLFLSHYEAHFYDFHPYLTVRESRRIKGLYELTLIDAAEATHFDDLITVASSDYDPHFVGYSEYTRCGFLLPHSNIVKVEIPYRAIVPSGLDGILISGKAFSQTQNALQFTRMSADLTVLGYLTGQVAAEAATSKVEPKDFNISKLQKEWFDRGFLPKEYAGKKAGNSTTDTNEINNRIKNLGQGKNEFLYECCKLQKETAVPLLRESFSTVSNPDGKLLTAKALAWFGETTGNELITAELAELFEKEQKEGHPGGYIDTYDDIRGREKNVIEGVFWKINQNIALLAMAGNRESATIIKTILENTTSGGVMVPRENDYFNERIDLRIVPFYNRILNLCFYAERVPDRSFILGFEKLLTDKNISGYVTGEYQNTRWKVYGAVLELNIGAAMGRCGSKTGYELLLAYLGDIHFNFRNFAENELRELTGAGHRSDKSAWQKYVKTLSFPQSCKGLVKEIEM